MQTRYLLPCKCGQKISIEARQAGQLLRCTCGKSLEAPAMLKMSALERAESEAAAREPSAPWGRRQSLILLGAAATLCALILGIYLLRSRPMAPRLVMDPEAIRRETQGLTPVGTWQLWQAVRAGGLDRRRPQLKQAYDEAHLRWCLRMAAVLVLTVAGVSLTIAPLMTRRIRVATRKTSVAPASRR